MRKTRQKTLDTRQAHYAEVAKVLKVLVEHDALAGEFDGDELVGFVPMKDPTGYVEVRKVEK
jgi:hypothetical protein